MSQRVDALCLGRAPYIINTDIFPMRCVNGIVERGWCKQGTVGYLHLRFRECAEFRELQSQVIRLIACRAKKEALVGIIVVVLHSLAAFVEGYCRLITLPDYVPGMQLACRKAYQKGDQ